MSWSGKDKGGRLFHDKHVLGNSLLVRSTNSTFGIGTDDDNDNNDNSNHTSSKHPCPDLLQLDVWSAEEAVQAPKSKRPKQTANVETKK